MSSFWKSLWEKQGSPRCKHCGRPIHRDSQSGYWMHSGDFETGEMPDGMNGYHCEAWMWNARGRDDPRRGEVRCAAPAGEKKWVEEEPVTAENILNAKEPPVSIEIKLRHEDSRRFHELLHKAGEMHDKKQQDYGRSEAPFANIEASVEWGVSPWVGSMIRLNDKVRRLQKPATGGSLENEGVLDSLMDIAVYALIAYVMYERDEMGLDSER